MYKIKQMAFRLYPKGYVGDSLGDLNKLLKDGWIVKITITEKVSDTTFHVMILEKNNIEPPAS